MKTYKASNSQSSQITIRLSKSDRETLAEAAALSKTDIAGYAKQLLRKQAREIRQYNPAIRLSRRDFAAFMKTCREPGRGSARLRRAVREYKESLRGAAV